MSYTIRYNGATNHITGFDLNENAGEFTLNTCGAVTRSRLAQGQTFQTATEALAWLESSARKTCKTCLKLVLAAVEAEVAAQVEAETVTETVEVATEVAETVEVATETVATEVATTAPIQYRPFGTEVLPPSVTMDPATRVLSGQARDMMDMYSRGIAEINDAGDLILK